NKRRKSPLRETGSHCAASCRETHGTPRRQRHRLPSRRFFRSVHHRPPHSAGTNREFFLLLRDSAEEKRTEDNAFRKHSRQFLQALTKRFFFGSQMRPYQ